MRVPTYAIFLTKIKNTFPVFDAVADPAASWMVSAPSPKMNLSVCTVSVPLAERDKMISVVVTFILLRIPPFTEILQETFVAGPVPMFLTSIVTFPMPPATVPICTFGDSTV